MRKVFQIIWKGYTLTDKFWLSDLFELKGKILTKCKRCNLYFSYGSLNESLIGDDKLGNEDFSLYNLVNNKLGNLSEMKVKALTALYNCERNLQVTHIFCLRHEWNWKAVVLLLSDVVLTSLPLRNSCVQYCIHTRSS